MRLSFFGARHIVVLSLGFTVDAGQEQTAIWPPEPSLQLTSDLRLDGAAERFGAIPWLAVSATGTLVFPLPGGRVRFCDSRGIRQVDLVPAQGGLTRMPAALGWVGDTLWQREATTGRIQLWSADSREPRPFDFPSHSSVVAVEGDGAVLTMEPLGVRRYGHYMETSAWILRADDKGSRYNSQTARVAVGAAFFAAPWLAVGPDGHRAAAVTTHLDSGRVGTLHIVMVNDRGDTVFARRLAFTGTPVSAEAVANRRAELLTLPETAYRLASLEAPIPEVTPPLAGISIGVDGSLFLELAGAETSRERQAVVLSPTGDVLGTVSVPASLKVWAVGARFLWATQAGGATSDDIVRFVIVRRPVR